MDLSTRIPSGTTMTGWISKAVNVFRRDVPETPQLFEVLCECERRHQGVRRSRHQHLVCKDCGASLFVLPRDEYPPALPTTNRPTATVSTPPPAETEKNSDVDEFEIPPLDPGATRKSREPEVPSAKKSKSAPELPARRLTKKERRKEQERREREQAKADAAKSVAERGPSLRQRTGRAIQSAAAKGRKAWIEFWTPFRSVAIAFLVIVLGTIAWNVRQELIRRAADTVKTGTQAGMVAVENRNWIEARRVLEPVVAALDRLGRTDEEAENLRRYFRETEALTRMSHASLFELIEAANAEVGKAGPEKWQEQFRNRYQGGWLVIEGSLTPITRKVEERTVKLFVMNIPWSPGDLGQRIMVEADFPVLHRLPAADQPRTLIFAGKLSGCRLDPDRREWVVTLDSKTGFLWSHLDTWVSLGFGEDAEVIDPRVREILEEQAAWSGVIL